jgi:hypothetical protein
MSEHNDHDSLLDEAIAAVRRVYNAGVAAGVTKERARLLQALQHGGESPPAVRVPPYTATEQARLRPATEGADTAPKEYGAISKPIRQALDDIGRMLDGVTPQEVADYCARHGSSIGVEQARTALKVLAKRGEAQRLERGRYIAGPKLQKTPSAATEGASE